MERGAIRLDALSDAHDACRRLASDLFAVGGWAEECRSRAELSSALPLLVEASSLSAACGALLAGERGPDPAAWRAFFARLDAFVREASALIDLAGPCGPAGERAALARLGSLLAENSDLVEGRDAERERAFAALLLNAARELSQRMGRARPLRRADT